MSDFRVGDKFSKIWYSLSKKAFSIEEKSEMGVTGLPWQIWPSFTMTLLILTQTMCFTVNFKVLPTQFLRASYASDFFMKNPNMKKNDLVVCKN